MRGQGHGTEGKGREREEVEGIGLDWIGRVENGGKRKIM